MLIGVDDLLGTLSLLTFHLTVLRIKFFEHFIGEERQQAQQESLTFQALPNF